MYGVVASKLYGVNDTIMMFVFVLLYCMMVFHAWVGDSMGVKGIPG